MLAKALFSRPGGPVVCYDCGEVGHFKWECPKKPAVVYPLGSVGYTCMRTGADPCMTKSKGGRSCDQAVEEVLHDEVLSPEVLHGDVLSPEGWLDWEWLPDISPGDLACTQRCWEFAEADKALSDGMAVKGRLRHHIHFWVEKLHATQWIIDMIQDGYMLPFYVEPAAYRRGNKNTAYANSVFVHNAVMDLVKGGFVEVVTEQPYIHVRSPASVVENSVGKKRLVVNLRHIKSSYGEGN